MLVEVTIVTKELKDINTIEVDAVVRYPEDSWLYDSEGKRYDDDEKNPQMPNIVNDGTAFRWKPIINLNTGEITNWPLNRPAEVLYKVCDEFYCEVKTADGETTVKYGGYVPDFMSINDNGYGDYIDLSIDKNGCIKNWKFTKKDFDYLVHNNLE